MMRKNSNVCMKRPFRRNLFSLEEEMASKRIRLDESGKEEQWKKQTQNSGQLILINESSSEDNENVEMRREKIEEDSQSDCYINIEEKSDPSDFSLSPVVRSFREVGDFSDLGNSLLSIESDETVEETGARKSNFDICSMSSSPGKIDDEASCASETFSLSSFSSPEIKPSIRSNDWMKEIDLKTPQNQEEIPSKNFHVSRRKKNFVKGGLAERLEKLTLKQQADSAIWRHQRYRLSCDRVEKNELLQLKILNIYKEYLNLFVRCWQIENVQQTTTNNENWIVVISLHHQKSLKLDIGFIMKIYPPWKTIHIGNNRQIFGANFIEVIDRTTEYFPRISNCIFKRSCPCTTNLSIDSKDCSAVINNRAKGTDHLVGATKTLQTVLEATEMNEFSLIACVQRIFNYYQESSQVEKWSLLLRDECEFFAEVHFTETNPNCTRPSVWEIRESKNYCFDKLRLIRKINKNRNPGLFSIMHSLKKSNENNETSVQQFCYILTQSDEGSNCFLFENKSANYAPPDVKPVDRIVQDLSDGCRCSTYVKLLLKLKDKIYVTDETCSSGTKGYLVVSLSPAVIHRKSCKLGCILFLKDLISAAGILLLDKYSRVCCVCCEEHQRFFLDPWTKCDDKQLDKLKDFTPTLDQLNCMSLPEQLVSVCGDILCPDDDLCYSWPICNLCSNDILQEINSRLFCDECENYVSKPKIKMRVEIYLKCSSVPKNSQVRLKLHQKSIEKLLPRAVSDEPFDVECILNKPIGPIWSYVEEVVHGSSNNCEDAKTFILREL